ncbi:cytochrome c biogenesis protein CcsA [Paucidesulfovibrio longus]|uniref:cytochrome c biogenesis protein CcsA n=1 Tax=Paucidesulfovibrio longus TaxID=889 RepID=UPI0003B7A5BE|nr:cytochrome c biogenesis protein CcsA [Paucidesulfovibrio longus]
MESFELLPLAVIGFYFLGALLFFIGLTVKNDRLSSVAGGLAIGGFALHSLDLALVFVRLGKAALLGGAFYFSFVAWTLLAIHLLLRWRLKSSFLSLTALPLALLLYSSSLAAGDLVIKIPPRLTALFFGLHVGSLAVTLALLALASGAGLAWLSLNRKIKSKTSLGNMNTAMPSLEVFDRVNHWAVSLGFPLYTLGIFSLAIWYWIDPEKAFRWDAMKFTSLGVWLLFAVLFHQRVIIGWRGRKPAWLAIWVFALMVVSLIHHTITFKS